VTELLTLTVYFGESDRVGGALLSDALLDAFAEQRVRASVLLRGVEGFGLNQTIRTDRFLSLSEDLPLLAQAVDEPARIDALLPRVGQLLDNGLVTIERARAVDDATTLAGDVKLTVYLGRDRRTAGRLVDDLRRHGLAGATVLLGVDGTAAGERRRARFFSRNAHVPLVVVAVGAADRIVEALPGLPRTVTVERVQVWKRDGVLLAEPETVPAEDRAGLALWQKVTVYGRPPHLETLVRLRQAGAAGATSVRGIWGFSGDHPPHGDRLTRVRRDVPVVTTIVDRPEAVRRLFAIVDEQTAGGGLVTSEIVPAFHAVAGVTRRGGLRLAEPTG
jgi:PII-like signaling protein